MARPGKFWHKNEREVMELLGLRQVPGSGNGWVAKEDGESEHVLCQLKSTDANSIRVQKQDIDKLEYHAIVSKKLPVFAIQFVRSGQVYLLVKPLDLVEAAKYVKSGSCSQEADPEGVRSSLGSTSGKLSYTKPRVVSSSEAREAYFESIRKKYERRRGAT
jgi:Holliday junction resolvase|nr:MAG TPA: hypothetical protein [Caudoviricetes sp.]